MNNANNKTIHTGNSVTEDLVNTIKNILDEGERLDVSFSVVGRTKHAQLGQELAEALGDDYIVTIDDNYGVHVEAVEHEHCTWCGCVITQEQMDNGEAGEINGDYVCEDCLQERYTWSDEEGEWIDNDDLVEVRTDGYNRTEPILCSEDYAQRNYIWSDWDDCYYENDGCGAYTYDDGFVGYSQLDDYFSECYDCGEIYQTSEMECINDEWYCSGCAEDQHAALLHDYHDFSDWQLYKSSKEIAQGVEPTWYIGHESEIDDGDFERLEDIHDLVTSNLNAIMMHDGSLSSRGIEIISHPQSYDYYVEHEAEYRHVFEELVKEYHYTSHENGRCGLHFHVTRPSDEVVDRVQLILENFKTELMAFSRREPSSLNRWAAFISDKVSIPREELLAEVTIKKCKDVANDTRYMALNNTNRRTIEFRFIRGTLKYNTFRASLDLINNIMTYASDLSLDLTTLTWADLVNTEYAQEYCIERGITSNRRLIDNSQKILKRDEDLQRFKVQYSDLLEQYKKYLVKEYNKGAAAVTDNLDDLTDRYRKIDDLYTMMRRIADYQAREYSATRYIVADMKDLTRCINSNYYKAKANKIWKEAEAVCVL